MAYETKEEQVADFLREGIISGKFSRGGRLKQVEIAEMLDISVTPVREALKMLEAEGYVIGSPHRGVVVAPFDIHASEEIIRLRVLLESQLVSAAMERLGPEGLVKFFEQHRKFEAAASRGDRNTVRAMNYRFHRDLYDAADLPQTLRFVKILWAQYPFDMINLVGGRMERAAAEHRVLLEAMASGDRAAALVAMRTHVESGWNELEQSLRDKERVADPPS